MWSSQSDDSTHVLILFPLPPTPPPPPASVLHLTLPLFHVRFLYFLPLFFNLSFFVTSSSVFFPLLPSSLLLCLFNFYPIVVCSPHLPHPDPMVLFSGLILPLCAVLVLTCVSTTSIPFFFIISHSIHTSSHS